MGFFDIHQTGELTTVLTANTALVRNGATTQLALALKGFVQFAAILTYLCATNGELTGFFMGIGKFKYIYKSERTRACKLRIFNLVLYLIHLFS